MNFALYSVAMSEKELNREKAIIKTSALGIASNIIIASIKLIVGFALSSIAIISEGINNATDAISSVLTIIGTKIANKKPDENHPFGYGRIEYITSLVISVLIVGSGIKLIVSAVELILNPQNVSIPYIVLVLIAVSGLYKFFLGVYTIRTGERLDSLSLVGVGTECRNDSMTSVVTIISALIFILFKLPVDAYAGLFTSAIIIKTGAEIFFETLNEIIGRPADKELADTLYKEIRSTKGILNAADMMLHNYGPERFSGSVNIELDHKLTVGETYSFIHELQLRIMHKYHVTMVFGIYAVDEDSEQSKKLRNCIASYVRKAEYVKSYHAVYFSKEEEKIYCDIVVDYKLKDWEELRKNFTAYMKENYPFYGLELTIETEFV